LCLIAKFLNIGKNNFAETNLKLSKQTDYL